jgi:hypothetical protein
MEFKLSRRVKKAYLWADVFFVAATGALLFFLFSNQSSVLLLIFDLVFLVVCLFNAIYFLLSIRMTSLETTDTTIEFRSPYGRRKIQCTDAVKLENNSNNLLLFYKKGASRPNRVLDLVIKKECIPLGMFVENWIDEKNWKKDSLLVWLKDKYQIEKKI